MKKRNRKSIKISENIRQSEFIEYVIQENFRDYGFLSQKSFVQKKSAEKNFESYVKSMAFKWGSSVKVRLIERKTVTVTDFTDFMNNPEFRSKIISTTTIITVIAK